MASGSETSIHEIMASLAISETSARRLIHKMLEADVIRIERESPGGRGKKTAYTLVDRPGL